MNIVRWSRLVRFVTRNRRVPADTEMRARMGTWAWLAGRDVWRPGQEAADVEEGTVYLAPPLRTSPPPYWRSRAELLDLIDALADRNPCSYSDGDRGRCMEHGWTADRQCPHGEARELLAALRGDTEVGRG